MRVAAFRIRNFRSIVDTGWVDLSRDGITALVGQNEAGKTSVLRAIDAFQNEDITADDQRSDDSLPEVYISFELPAPPSKLLEGLELPSNLDRDVKELGMRLNLLRTWDGELNALEPILDPGQHLAELLFPEEDGDEVEEGGVTLGPVSAKQFARCVLKHHVLKLIGQVHQALPTRLASRRDHSAPTAHDGDSSCRFGRLSSSCS